MASFCKTLNLEYNSKIWKKNVNLIFLTVLEKMGWSKNYINQSINKIGFVSF